MRRRLFAADWGIDLEELEEEEKVTGRGPRVICWRSSLISDACSRVRSLIIAIYCRWPT
jgi:hypothetical protein